MWRYEVTRRGRDVANDKLSTLRLDSGGPVRRCDGLKKQHIEGELWTVVRHLLLYSPGSAADAVGQLTKGDWPVVLTLLHALCSDIEPVGQTTVTALAIPKLSYVRDPWCTRSFS